MRPVALAAIAAGLTLSTLLGAADGASSSSETSQAGNGKIAFATAAFLVEGNIAPGGIEAEPTAFPGRNGAILAGGGANGKLYSLSADGRRRTVIRGIRTAWVGGGSAAWSPDGTRLAFARHGGGIAIADASSRHPIRVTERGREPAWSPDGSQLVFTQGSSLYLVRADGRGLRRLFPGRNAQWSPDGSRIAFQLHDEGTGGGDSIYVSALDGSQRLRLATGGIPSCVPGLIHNQEPAWTPDGSRIAYSTWLWCGNNADASIGAVSPDGSQHWTLVKPQGYPGGASAPVWSPDGRALAYFESYDDGGASDGLSVLPLGGKARRIARDWLPFDWRPVCELRGGPRADRLQGGDRAELLCGLGGNDAITGGAGRDRLFGEQGADRIFAQDGEFDVVGCGAGRDTVDADTGDLVGRDCERVSRR